MACLLSVMLGVNMAFAATSTTIRAPLIPLDGDNKTTLADQLILPHSNVDPKTGVSSQSDIGGRLLPTITNIVVAASGGASVLFIIIGAIQMLTAYGNDEKISQGKKTITFAIVGLIIAILSYTIVTIISSINLNSPPPTT
jgi:hypothetical protein